MYTAPEVKNSGRCGGGSGFFLARIFWEYLTIHFPPLLFLDRPFPPLPRRINMGGQGGMLELLSVILSIPYVWSRQYNISWTAHPFFFFFNQTRYGVYYHVAMCHAEKLVHYLQCQGHSKGFYNQNMTVLVHYLQCQAHGKGFYNQNMTFYYIF